MIIRVEGVSIELTSEQMALIEANRKERAKCRNSFKKMLRFFGFKAMKDSPGSYWNEEYKWYADIQDRGPYFTVWMTGEGLKNSGAPPGGWIYEEPEDIENAILKFLAGL